MDEHLLVVSHWSLSDKSLQVSCQYSSWSQSSRSWDGLHSSAYFPSLLVLLRRTPITIGITVTFIVLSFFNSLARSRYLSFLTISFNFTLWSAGTQSPKLGKRSFSLLIITRSSCLAELKWSVCVWKSLRNLSVYSSGRILDFACTILSYVQISIFGTILSGSPLSPSCSYFLRFLHSLIMGLNVSSLSPHDLYSLFCCILSIFD